MTRKVGSALVGAALIAIAAVVAGTVHSAPQEPGLTGVEAARLREAFRRVDENPFPEDNPYSPQASDLGARLFFDPILSGEQTMACASCHNPATAWTEGRPRGIGESGIAMKQRTPTLLNVAGLGPLGWDGKFPDLESVSFTPIVSSGVMNLPEAVLIARLRADPSYVRDFTTAYGENAITRQNIERALATYERSIVSGAAPFDRWLAGDDTAIGASAKAGLRVFSGKGGCIGCHSGWAFTDGSFHDIGVATGADTGRGSYFPTSVKLRYAFKTPTLRDVTTRAPYMHDGSIATLRAVIDLYDRGGIDRPSRSPAIRPLNLSETEKANLIAFLETLNSETTPTALPLR
ncbi:c-type cytochrome [Methylobacterium sp. BTF04]|nr:cytochrome c peroxidase [Methylobacterium sp. BTF04]NEU14118.1 c-type cytochrome [Methylobacterium sp. BTF04]